ncbi:MAG: carbon-nitrogen hydrolase family protein [Pseudomonadota bacterium]
MRLAVYQGGAVGRDVDEQLDHLAEVARHVADRGARLLVLPEMYLTGYHIGADAVAALAEPVTGPSAERAAAIAQATGVALLYGYPERGDDGRIYNAALLIDREGRQLANHRKVHLFGEIDRSAFSPGDGQPTLAEIDGIRVGLLICYDVEFPEAVRLLALEGADLILVPTALMAPYDFIARSLVPTRAYENQVFVTYANRVGAEHELTYLGQSCIIGPDGAELARAGRDEELIVADLNPSSLSMSRAINTYFQDRRPDLYGALVAGRSVPRDDAGGTL